MHVLLIEDDTEAARFLVKGLRESGYTVEHAADGRAGLTQTTSGQFDLVITDRMLPHVDGLTVIETMRAKGIATPVLVLSALGGVDDRVRGLKSRRRRLPHQTVRVCGASGTDRGTVAAASERAAQHAS